MIKHKHALLIYCFLSVLLFYSAPTLSCNLSISLSGISNGIILETESKYEYMLYQFNNGLGIHIIMVSQNGLILKDKWAKEPIIVNDAPSWYSGAPIFIPVGKSAFGLEIYHNSSRFSFENGPIYFVQALIKNPDNPRMFIFSNIFKFAFKERKLNYFSNVSIQDLPPQVLSSFISERLKLFKSEKRILESQRYIPKESQPIFSNENESVSK